MTDTPPRTRTLLTAFEVVANAATGYVVDPSAPRTRFVVELLADGLPIAVLRAQDYREDLGIGDGCYGFSTHLSPAVVAQAERLEARLANSGDLIGSIAAPGQQVLAPPGAGHPGQALWATGLRVTGWLTGRGPDVVPIVKALVEGHEVARASCRGWSQVGEEGVYGVFPSFDLDLPPTLADGRVHTVEIMTEDGIALRGSPCLVFALADGFAGVIDAHAELHSERVRARFADGLLPRRVPLSDFADWRRRFPLPSAPVHRPFRIAVLIVGQDRLDDTLASLEGQIGADWSASVLASTQTSVQFTSRSLRAFMAAESTADLVVATVSGARFAPEALGLFAEAADAYPTATAFYGDIVTEIAGRSWPLGFPAYDDELFLEQGYCGLCFAFRPTSATTLEIEDCTSLYELFPAPMAGGAPAALPVHLPTTLASLPELPRHALTPVLRDASLKRLARRGESAEVVMRPEAQSIGVRIRRRSPSRSVSILIGVRNGGDALRQTIEGIAATQGEIRPEIVVADNASSDPATLAVLETLNPRGHQLLRLDGLFSEAHLINRAAAASRGDMLLVLRPGVVPRQPGWLDEMLSRCVGRDVGAVGGMVTWPEGHIREAGFIVGPHFSVVGRFRDRHADDAGYAGWLEVAHQVSAVSAACLMTARTHFDGVGGLDERCVSTDYHDVDYCLRLRAAGLRIIFTPHARLSQGRRDPVQRSATSLRAVTEREGRVLGSRWRLVPGCDPFYSPWMSMDAAPYAGLGWPPIPFHPRQPVPPVASPLPIGS